MKGQLPEWEKHWGLWEENGRQWDKLPTFHSPIAPMFPGVEDLPHNSHSPMGQWEIFPPSDTHGHSS